MSTEQRELAEVGTVVRRSLAARTHDHDLIEDLTQETLLRLARSELELTADAQRAYAVVTARNLLASHHRSQSVRGRHLHRLVDHDGVDDPAQLTVDKEESDALAVALAQLDPAERELLLRHEVAGTELATLADEADVSRGAIAMRLARARANLRLEFLLVFRRLELPTERCRPVLLAVSTGDRRRQVQLGADDHLATCGVCASLEDPMTQRNRRIAAWLLVPAAEGLRRGWRVVRNHPARVAAVVFTATAITAGVVVAVQSAPESSAPATTIAASTNETTGGAPSMTGTVAPTSAAPVAPATPAPVATSAPLATPAPATSPPLVPTTPAVEAGTAPPATVAAAPPAPADDPQACPPPAPLEELSLDTGSGCPFAFSVVTVVEISDGGFRATTGGQRTVAVELVGTPRVALPLAPGLRVGVAGVVTGAGQQLSVEVAAGDLRLAG